MSEPSKTAAEPRDTAVDVTPSDVASEMSESSTNDAGPALSVLDIVPVTAGRTSRDSITASLNLVQLADQLGYHRYWFAEHHNTDSAASTSPPVLTALAAARTHRIRVGSGGVMLPNHAPLVIAEQFATLEAAAPGRIDLGIGRSSGSDHVVANVLGTRADMAATENFGAAVHMLQAVMAPDGARLRTGDGYEATVRATAVAEGRPEMWLLGSRTDSARLAGALGLRYTFAHHFFERGAEEALAAYRDNFRPTGELGAPETVVSANVVVAATHEEAMSLALPGLLQIVRIQTGQPLPVHDTVERAVDIARDPRVRRQVELVAQRWFIGTAHDVRGRLRDFAAELDVDELLLAPTAGRSSTDPPGRALHRETTLRLLAQAS